MEQQAPVAPQVTASQEQPLPPEISALSQASMEAFRHHPVMVGVRRYLRDYAEKIEQEHLRRWKDGSMLSSADEQQQSLYAQTLRELEGLRFDHIARFYVINPPEETDTDNESREPQAQVRDD